MTKGHTHEHGAGALLRAGEVHRRPLAISFVLVLAFFFVEVTAGFFTNSLALLSDAGHMFTDVLGLGMALAAIHLASKAASNPQRTFGLYRLEILAAVVNGLLLLGVAVYVLIEAVRRFLDPPQVLSGPMLVVAIGGLIVNLVAFALLRRGSKESLNVQGAYLEVMSDAIGSVGVILAALVTTFTKWPYADPIIAAAIGLFIVPRTLRLISQAVRILVQAAPPGMDPGEVKRDLASIDGVTDVHDLHLWTLTSGMEVATAHLRISEHGDGDRVLQEAKTLLRERYEVKHATLQVEGTAGECEGCSW